MSYDIVFKSVFLENPNILAKMVSDITSIPYMLLKDNIVLECNELPISSKNEKFKKCDFVVRIGNDVIINIEVNKDNYIGLQVKNMSYVFQLFYRSFKKEKEYNSELNISQININCFKMNNKEALSSYHIRRDSDYEVYNNNFVIYDLNVVNCSKLYYNTNKEEIPNYVRWGMLINCTDFNEIPEIMEGVLTKEECESLMNVVTSLTREDLFLPLEDSLEWEEYERNCIRNQARNDGLKQGMKQGMKQGIEQGIEQGIIQNLKLTITNMLNKNYSFEEIAEITGKSCEEIKKYID